MAQAPLNVLVIEPWLGGSHARFLETWCAHSAHSVQVLGLPARHWQWRMEGAAHTLARRVADLDDPSPADVLVVSDYLDLARFRGFLTPAWSPVPALLYLHESQLTYPSQPDSLSDSRPDARDARYGLTNLLSCLAAQGIAFNSAFHRDTFWQAGRELLERLPRPSPRAEFERAMDASCVVFPGVDLAALPLGPGPPPGAPLRVAFNHRWEHDKDPVGFLRAVLAAREAGAALDVVMLGEVFERTPAELPALQAQLGCALLQSGFVEDRREYARLLGECDLVVSTARHEFYGIAVLEALACGCAPLAPDRLAYPEVLAPSGLYTDEARLIEGLTRASHERDSRRSAAHREACRAAVLEHDAVRSAGQMDALCESIFDLEPSQGPGISP